MTMSQNGAIRMNNAATYFSPGMNPGRMLHKGPHTYATKLTNNNFWRLIPLNAGRLFANKNSTPYMNKNNTHKPGLPGVPPISTGVVP